MPQDLPFRVGIDYRPVHKPSSARRGIGTYTRNLTRALGELIPAEQLYLCTSQESEIGPGTPIPVKWPRRPGRLHWIWDRMFLPRKLAPYRLDFFHATDQVCVPLGLKRTKVLMHLHDVIPFLFWEDYAVNIPYDFRLALKRSLRLAARASAVITDSECSRQDILKFTGARAENIYVVPFGCDAVFKPVTDSAAQQRFIREKQLKTPYLIYVGATDYRKNIPFLIRVFGRLRERGYRGSLYLVGELFKMAQLAEVKKIYAEISRSKYADSIFMPGYVATEELPFYLSCSDAFVFPSLYEGFGLPVLEAMSCGTAVVAANRSSIPEVLGEAGLYFDPTNEEECVARLEAITGRPDLRRDLIERGLARAGKFSWKQAAERIVEIWSRIKSRARINTNFTN